MKIKLNKKGFSLTEVLVAVLVLTMAVVSASNFLVPMMRSNAMNTSVLQAYYYSVEGLEAFRNIRDTYFMNYLDFCGSGDIGGNGGIFLDGGFCDDGLYVVAIDDDGVNLESVGNGDESDESDESGGSGEGKVGLITESGISLDDFNRDGEGAENVSGKKFYRVCEVKSINSASANEETSNGQPGTDAKQITCMTTYKDGSKTGEVSLKTILTDWKE